MIIGKPCAIAATYGWIPAASVAFDAVSFTTYESVFNVARPMPGKCFIAGTTPADQRPRANEFDRVVVRIGSNDHVRPCRYMNEAVELGTSATGAKSQLMPRPSSARPVATP